MHEERKILSLILIFCLTLGLLACGQISDSETELSSETELPVETELSSETEFSLESESETAASEEFSWYKFIRDELLQEMGYANTDEYILEDVSYPGCEGWNYRSGLLAADVVDMNGDGIEDLLIYYYGGYDENVEDIPNYWNWGKVFDLYAALYTRDSDDNIEMINPVMLIANDGTGLELLNAGLMEIGGQTMLYVEAWNTTYFGDDGGFAANYTWYGYDETRNIFRKYHFLGDVFGGSAGSLYVLSNYSDKNTCDATLISGNSEYVWTNEPNFLYDRGFSSVTIYSKEDDDWVKTGFSMLGVPDVGSMVSGHRSWYDYYSYFNSEVVKKSISQICKIKFPSINESAYSDVTDYTDFIIQMSLIDGDFQAPPRLYYEGASEKNQNDEDYILFDSSSRILTYSDIKDLSMEELRLARNEIYARHGRMFKDAELQEYFDSKSWYIGNIDSDDFSEEMLSAIEKENIAFIKTYE